MREVDRLVVEVFGIQIIQMMENAGRNLAALVRFLLGDSVMGKYVVIAAGKGNNGGGGMVAARHLYNWGAGVTVLLPDEPLHNVAEIQRKIIERFPLVMKTGEAASRHLYDWKGDIIIDALIGYGLSGRPRGWVFKMINAINATNAPVVSLDIPSGLDASTGEICKPCVNASVTMTLALPKTGLLKPEARSVIGSLYLADIGIPDVLYKEIGIDVGPIFINDTIIKLYDSEGETQL